MTCSNNIQAVFQDEMCDGVAQCVGSPSDEVDCSKYIMLKPLDTFGT